MTKREQEIVHGHLRIIYGDWHSCRMGTRSNPLLPADEKRGIKKGQLCDTCEAMVKAHMKDIVLETGAKP